MDLHEQIMSIRCDAGNASTDNTRIAYTEGHRDARHAAAELARRGDVVARAAHRLLDWVSQEAEQGDCINWYAVNADEGEKLRQALLALAG